MVHISVIQSQITRLGIRLSRWFTPELKELQHIMMDKEKIIAAAPGRYFGGMALLVATDLRLLLIDKRTFFMTIEDTRYDMVTEIDFSSRLYDLTVHIFTPTKQHNFTSIRYKAQLRDLCNYVQQRVWELRQSHQESAAAATSIAAADPPPQPPAPPLATTFGPTLAPLAHELHLPHPTKPHLPRHIGFAAMNGSRRYTPPVYANHLVARSRSFASE